MQKIKRKQNSYGSKSKPIYITNKLWRFLDRRSETLISSRKWPGLDFIYRNYGFPGRKGVKFWKWIDGIFYSLVSMVLKTKICINSSKFNLQTRRLMMQVDFYVNGCICVLNRLCLLKVGYLNNVLQTRLPIN